MDQQVLQHDVLRQVAVAAGDLDRRDGVAAGPDQLQPLDRDVGVANADLVGSQVGVHDDACARNSVVAIPGIGGEQDRVGGVGRRALDLDAAREQERRCRVLVRDPHLLAVVGHEAGARNREVSAGHTGGSVDAVLPRAEGRELAPDEVAQAGSGGPGIALGEQQARLRAGAVDRVVHAVRGGAVEARGRIVAGDRDHVAAPAVRRPPGRAARARHGCRPVADADGARAVGTRRPDRAVVGRGHVEGHVEIPAARPVDVAVGEESVGALRGS